MLTLIWDRWTHRRRYATFMAMPTWLLISLAVPAGVGTTCGGWILTRSVPVYFDAAREAGEFGVEGTILGLALISVGLLTWHFGEIVTACCKEIRKRFYT